MTGPIRRDTEAFCEKKASRSLTGRLMARLSEDAPDHVHGPVDEAVAEGAKVHSLDAATFLADFHAIRSRRVARPDQMLEVVIRVPGKDSILALDKDLSKQCEKQSMYEWLSLLRSRLLDIPADAFVALFDPSLTPDMTVGH
ncbi:MAG: hypothetical protein Q9215_006373 [Flavoplaca cf. flavocitrina]